MWNTDVQSVLQETAHKNLRTDDSGFDVFSSSNVSTYVIVEDVSSAAATLTVNRQGHEVSDVI